MKIRKLLVANRSEIAIRVFRAASELGIRTVAIYAQEDKLGLHRFKADESYLVGEGKKPIDAYLDIDDIIRIAKEVGADAIHPGYGFLSENPDFVDACNKAGIIFIGPHSDVMRKLGNKVSARKAAQEANVPVVPATEALPQDFEAAAKMAAEVGYPLMLKASWGGGGRGMRVVEDEAALKPAIETARREATAAFGNDEVYLEKLVRRARHVEVQVLGDKHGNLVHLFERDCSVQRRNQKVVERAPAPYLNDELRQGLCDAALSLCKAVDYTHAGTVEFLMDADTNEFYFIEVNPRIQVEHTVTEEVTGVDLVKAQIHVAQGERIGGNKIGEEIYGDDTILPSQDKIVLNGHALQCRVTTEDPENNFTPDYGKIVAYRSPAGLGIRLDGGTAYSGAVITPYFDSLLVKLTTWGQTTDEASIRMDRALREFRIRGISSNLFFLENVVAHPLFRNGQCTTRFIDETPELFEMRESRDRASKLLNFIGEVVVNGNPEMKGREAPAQPMDAPAVPAIDLSTEIPKGSRDIFKELGADGFSKWMKDQKQILLTDTTMRDAHQSLFATRMRTADMLPIAPYYSRNLPQLFSMECWGGATFDVSMRFLKEDPWDRLRQLREACPNILFQMLLRASNAVGYKNYPDNVVKFFTEQAAKNGIDVFRVFDSLNWVENMRVAMDAVIESGAICEGTMCYTSDIFDAKRPKYQLDYYVKMARELEKAGAHVLGIKDMAGICRPPAIRELVKALKQETDLPIHFHTHDTSGGSIATVLAAVEAGADAVDGAVDSMSGLTSQPSLGALVAALENSERNPGFTYKELQPISQYWEKVRSYYSPFEPSIRSGTSDVYRHEMPGGQYTNLREQARSMGLDHRWSEIAQAYADVNLLFGDIVKVTPSSKVVGDMALMMVANDLTPEEVADPDREIPFPESVVQMFKGEMGYPEGGFPEAIQKKVLKDIKPIDGRVGAHLEPADLDAERAKVEDLKGDEVSDTDLASYLMYPKVFSDYAEHTEKYGDVSVLPTPVFFYGLPQNEVATFDIDKGKSLLVSLHGRADHDEEGEVKLFFELNGQSRNVKVTMGGHESMKKDHPKAEDGNQNHIAAPMLGSVVTVPVKVGQKVYKGDPLISLEAMKMETLINAERDAYVKDILVSKGAMVEAKDLLIVLSDSKSE